MGDSPLLPIFDGHNDVLLRLYRPLPGKQRSFFERSDTGHLDLPRAQEGGLGGGFFAVFVPAPEQVPDHDKEAIAPGERYLFPLPPPLELSYAQRTALGMAGLLFRLEAEAQGGLRVVRAADELASCLAQGTIAAILHFEGAEPIDPELAALDLFYQAGLRSLGLVWSRPNDFATGVPFGYGHSPDSGPGLTEAGRALVRACNRLGILIDLSHLNERGFWDVAALSDAPLVATHSNAYALCPSTRNLTDKQLDAIRESDGMVGVNFEISFLRPEGGKDPDLPLSVIVDQVDYLVERLGVERVGFGSDFDGATMPLALGDAAGLPRLLAALRERGYDEAALRKLAHENWLRVLRATWHS
jgi:membrane dipeptidase